MRVFFAVGARCFFVLGSGEDEAPTDPTISDAIITNFCKSGPGRVKATRWRGIGGHNVNCDRNDHKGTVSLCIYSRWAMCCLLLNPHRSDRRLVNAAQFNEVAAGFLFVASINRSINI